MASTLNILIIDDEPVDREIFKQYLDADQPETFVYADAGTGQEGLQRLQEFRPDCILLDLNLPDVDGLKMIRLLHEEREMLPCAVVMLTGTGNEEIAVEAMKLGVMDYMVKGPASAHALPRVVASAVQRFRFQDEIARQRLALQQRNRELEEIRAQLFEEKERYRLLAENIPQLVWTADSNGYLHYANHRLWEFIGRMDAKPWPIHSLVHADERTGLWNKWNEAAQTGCAFETELRLRRAQDHTWRWHLMRTAPLPSADGEPVRWFGTFTDIEDQRRAEGALRQREKLDSIGVLAAGVAHDFNNLLVGIMGGASVVRESLDQSHPTWPMLEMVLRSSERAAQLTQQLLAYAGKVEIGLEPANISQVVRNACEPVQTTIPPNIRLIIETADDTPPIDTNTGHLKEVIVNLVMNAVEAIGEEDGAVRVRTAVEPVKLATDDSDGPRPNVLGYELAEGSYVLIEVTDSGPGMDDQTQTQIFDPFFTTKFMGRGLGLAVVQGIVRSLQGGIRVSSAPGSGSSFQVLLPMRERVGYATATDRILNGVG
jgi:PAS domain S-box-containing protein